MRKFRVGDRVYILSVSAKGIVDSISYKGNIGAVTVLISDPKYIKKFIPKEKIKTANIPDDMTMKYHTMTDDIEHLVTLSVSLSLETAFS